jgi:hypothetical protein
MMATPVVNGGMVRHRLKKGSNTERQTVASARIYDYLLDVVLKH